MLVMLLFSLSVNAAEPSISSPASSLGRLVEVAEQNSPTIRKFQLALDQAQLEVKSARAKFLPSLDLESKLAAKGFDPASRDAKNKRYDSVLALKLTETFYDNGESVTKYKAAINALELKRLEFEIERDNQLLKLAGTFYDWSAKWQNRQISNNKADLLRRQFNILEAQYKQGIKTKRDVLRIETEVRRLQIDLLRADNELEVVLQRLASQAGVDVEGLKTAKISADEAKADAPIPMGPWSEVKIENHRRSKIFARQSEEAQLQSRLKERNYWPQIALTGELSGNDSGGETPRPFMTTDYWGWAAMVSLKYNIWDWGTRNRDLQIARVNERKVQAGNEQARLDLGIELHEVWLKLREFAESVKMTKELLVIEQQSFNILEAEYRNGRATYLDLITNLNSLIDARSKYASTYFDLKKQQTIYAFHKGTLHEDLKPK